MNLNGYLLAFLKGYIYSVYLETAIDEAVEVEEVNCSRSQLDSLLPGKSMTSVSFSWSCFCS